MSEHTEAVDEKLVPAGTYGGVSFAFTTPIRTLHVDYFGTGQGKVFSKENDGTFSVWYAKQNLHIDLGTAYYSTDPIDGDIVEAIAPQGICDIKFKHPSTGENVYARDIILEWLN